MKTFLLFFAILASHCAFTQNRVVKDNLACLYGIKNAQGTWVVKPKYLLLTGYDHGYFLIQEGANYGLLDYDGTQLLPCEYSKIKPLNYRWHPYAVGQPISQISTSRAPLLFEIEKNNLHALVDSMGKTIVPLGIHGFLTDGQQHVKISEYRAPNHFTSYIDLSGNYLFKNVPGVIDGFGSNQIALIGLRTPGSKGIVEGNVRVINKKGEYVVAQQFERAIICDNERIIFEDSAGHIGAMDKSGKILIEPKYQFIFKSYSSQQETLSCLYGEKHTFIIKDDFGKLGLMNGTGKVLSTPAYEILEESQGRWKTDHTAWRVQKNGKMGMLRENGTLSIPCIYDTIIAFKMRYGANTSLDGFIVSDSNRNGLISTKGDTIIALEHVFFQSSPESGSVLFGNPEALKEITVVNDSLDIAPIEKLVQIEMYSVFKGKKERYFVLKEAENGALEMIRAQRYMNVIAFQEPRKNDILLDLSGKRLDDGNVYSVAHTFHFIAARTSDNTSYLINTKTAKRITQPILKAEFELNGSSSEHVWSKGVVEPLDEWVLLDTNGRRNGTESFEKPFALTLNQTSIQQGGFWGIYSVVNREWILSPKYVCIDELSDGLLRARLQNGLWELHVLKEDTAVYGPFESLEFLFSEHQSNGYNHYNVIDMNFLASQDGSSFLINLKGEKITNQEEITRIQRALAFGIYKPNENEFNSSGFKIKQEIPDFKLTELYEQLYDTIASWQPKRSANTVSMNVNERTCSCRTSSNMSTNYELKFAKSNAASVATSMYLPSASSWDVGYTTNNYMNVILVKGELKWIKLRAIFGNNDQLLYNEFKRAIKADETLDLECSTASNMLEIIGNKYHFSNEGLVLIVEQNSGRLVNIIIPWTRLAEVPTTRSFANLFLNQSQ